MTTSRSKDAEDTLCGTCRYFKWRGAGYFDGHCLAPIPFFAEEALGIELEHKLDDVILVMDDGEKKLLLKPSDGEGCAAHISICYR